MIGMLRARWLALRQHVRAGLLASAGSLAFGLFAGPVIVLTFGWLGPLVVIVSASPLWSEMAEWYVHRHDAPCTCEDRIFE